MNKYQDTKAYINNLISCPLCQGDFKRNVKKDYIIHESLEYNDLNRCHFNGLTFVIGSDITICFYPYRDFKKSYHIFVGEEQRSSIVVFINGKRNNEYPIQFSIEDLMQNHLQFMERLSLFEFYS